MKRIITIIILMLLFLTTINISIAEEISKESLEIKESLTKENKEISTEKISQTKITTDLKETTIEETKEELISKSNVIEEDNINLDKENDIQIEIKEQKIIEHEELESKTDINNEITNNDIKKEIVTEKNNIINVDENNLINIEENIEINDNEISRITSNNYASGELIIKFKDNINIDSVKNNMYTSNYNSLNNLNKNYVVTSFERIVENANENNIDRLYKITFSDEKNIIQALSDFKNNEYVEYVEPNYWLEFNDFSYPNDEHFNNQWHLNNNDDYDIDLPETFNEYGGGNKVIAIIDSGVDYTHEDLANNIWYNSGEIGIDTNGSDKKSNGIDDDSNGYIDDWRGYDVQKDDNDPMYDHISHGTGCAGIAAAKTNNNIGIAGVAGGCKIMCIKAGDYGLYYENAIKGVNYAIENGADVISMSFSSMDTWGWPYGQIGQALYDSTRNAYNNGIVLVACAGNYNSNQPSYPAAYSHVIGVGGTNQNDKRWSSSNYGSWVDVAAPASNIYTTYPNNNYNSDSGTSFACPQVSGLAALLLSKGYSKSQVYSRIKNGVDMIDTDEEIGSGRINTFVSMSGNPGKPYSPKGEKNGFVNTSYSFSTSAMDPDSSNLYYQFDWGDGNISNWLGPYARSTDKNVQKTHSWKSPGSYNIKVRAKDTVENIGEWSKETFIQIATEDGNNDNSTDSIPVAIINGPNRGGIKELLTFDASESYILNGEEIVRYDWKYNWSLGWKENLGPHINIKFLTRGIKTIHVKVYNKNGDFSVKSLECEIVYKIYIDAPETVERGTPITVITKLNHENGLRFPADVYFSGTNTQEKTRIYNLYKVTFSTDDCKLGIYELHATAAIGNYNHPINYIIEHDTKYIEIIESSANNDNNDDDDDDDDQNDDGDDDNDEDGNNDTNKLYIDCQRIIKEGKILKITIRKNDKNGQKIAAHVNFPGAKNIKNKYGKTVNFLVDDVNKDKLYTITASKTIGNWEDDSKSIIIKNKIKPSVTISGPSTGSKFHYYKFTADANDPDGDNSKIKYQFRSTGHVRTIWRNGETKNYMWLSKGEKTVEVRVKDEDGEISGWKQCKINIV